MIYQQLGRGELNILIGHSTVLALSFIKRFTKNSNLVKPGSCINDVKI